MRYNDPWMLPPIDEILDQRLSERGSDKAIEKPVLRRLELNSSEAGKLLRLLAGEHVTGTQMYPGLAGAVDAVRERALWDQQTATSGD